MTADITLAEAIVALVAEKRAVGYKYQAEQQVLARFERFSRSEFPDLDTLTEASVQAWIGSANQRDVQPATLQGLAAPVRELARWLARRGVAAYLLPGSALPKPARYVPHIYTDRELAAPVIMTGTVHRLLELAHSRVKQYLKEGRALRIETVINKPKDLGVLARIEHLHELVDKARQVNDRLLMIEKAGQGCAIGSALFERIHQPYNREGQRTGALRFGDQRAMALAGSLCLVVHAVTGLTNKSLRGLVAGLLGTDYTASQMSYDLRRLRLHGLIARVPRTNTYVVTPEGIRVAVFYTKLRDRLLGPLLEADKPPAPLELRRALHTVDHALEAYITGAHLGTAA
jgi:predicted transcriptional regulator